MCIYPHSLGVLCLRAPIRLHHLHSSLQNNVHRGACCTFWFQPEEPSSLPGASVTSWYPWAEIPLQPHPELRTQGLPRWAKLGWRKLWDSHIRVWHLQPQALESPEAGQGPAPIFMGRAGNVRSLQDPAKWSFVFLIPKWILRQGGILPRRIKEWYSSQKILSMFTLNSHQSVVVLTHPLYNLRVFSTGNVLRENSFPFD